MQEQKIDDAEYLEQRNATLKVVNAYHLAWRHRDLAGIVAMLHKDVLYHDFFINRSMGLKDIPSYIQGCLPNREGELITHTDRIRVDGDTAYIQYKLVMQKASYRSSEAITIKDGLIFRINEYGVLLREGETSESQTLNNDRCALSRLGLSARELANLSKDLELHFERDQPFLKSDLSLQQVADRTGYTRNQISYFLNNITGQTFYQYVSKARIEYILIQIEGNKKTHNIDELAYHAGFNSLSAFYKHFRRITHQSPKSYLKEKFIAITE